ncbi:MAG: FAD/FMN-containing dehydrogenases, partial [uncultured Ramlibacter sp.]
KGHHAAGIRSGGGSGAGIPVPRPLPHTDETAGADEDRQGPGRRERAQVGALLRRVGHVRRDAARYLHPGPVPQGGAAASGRGGAPIDRGGARQGRHQGADQLPELPARLVPLQPRFAERAARSRLHRGRDGQPDPGQGLDAGIRPGRECRRHRAGAGL